MNSRYHKFLRSFLDEKEQLLFTLYMNLRRLLPTTLTLSKIVDQAKSHLNENKPLRFQDPKINTIIPEIIRTEQVITSVVIILQSSGDNVSPPNHFRW